MKKFNRKRKGEERITMFQTCWGLVRRRLTSTSWHKPILPLCWYDCGLFPSAIRWLSVLLKWHWSCRWGHPVPFYGGLSGRDLLGRFSLLFLSPWWLVGWLGGPSWKFTPKGKNFKKILPFMSLLKNSFPSQPKIIFLCREGKDFVFFQNKKIPPWSFSPFSLPFFLIMK